MQNPYRKNSCQPSYPFFKRNCTYSDNESFLWSRCRYSSRRWLGLGLLRRSASLLIIHSRIRSTIHISGIGGIPTTNTLLAWILLCVWVVVRVWVHLWRDRIGASSSWLLLTILLGTGMLSLGCHLQRRRSCWLPRSHGARIVVHSTVTSLLGMRWGPTIRIVVLTGWLRHDLCCSFHTQLLQESASLASSRRCREAASPSFFYSRLILRSSFRSGVKYLVEPRLWTTKAKTLRLVGGGSAGSWGSEQPKNTYVLIY